MNHQTTVRERVEAARRVQHQRFDGTTIHANANMESKQIREYCPIESQAQDLLRVAINQLGLSARAYDRILKVSRTIADLEGNPNIETTHVSESIQYRSLDQKFLEKVTHYKGSRHAPLCRKQAQETTDARTRRTNAT